MAGLQHRERVGEAERRCASTSSRDALLGRASSSAHKQQWPGAGVWPAACAHPSTGALCRGAATEALQLHNSKTSSSSPASTPIAAAEGQALTWGQVGRQQQLAGDQGRHDRALGAAHVARQLGPACRRCGRQRATRGFIARRPAPGRGLACALRASLPRPTPQPVFSICCCTGCAHQPAHPLAGQHTNPARALTPAAQAARKAQHLLAGCRVVGDGVWPLSDARDVARPHLQVRVRTQLHVLV